MANTIGYHWVKSGYGLWLPGDERGHWSSEWDQMIGYTEPGMLHEGDPVRRRMAMERMTHQPVRLTSPMMEAVIGVLERCAAESPWKITALSIEPTHLHALITFSPLDIHRSIKWVTQEMTKAIHRQTDHAGPIWGEGRWLSYIFQPAHWENAQRYIERHNERRGLGARPYGFVTG